MVVCQHSVMCIEQSFVNDMHNRLRDSVSAIPMVSCRIIIGILNYPRRSAKKNAMSQLLDNQFADRETRFTLQSVAL